MASFVNLIDQRRLIGPGGSTVSGDIYFYYTGTSNLAPVWLDAGMTIPSPNPIAVGAGEIVPLVFLDSEIIYRRVIIYSDGTQDEQDPLGTLFTEGELGVPIATILDYSGATAPTGFLFCFGQAIDRTTYADLFAEIGTTYGAGNGVTTFNIPDLRGRVVAGKDNMGGIAAGRLTEAVVGSTLGAVGGEQEHILTDAEMPAHDHGGVTSSDGAHTHSTDYFLSSDVGAQAGAVIDPSGTRGAAVPSSSDGAHTHTITSEGSGDGHNIVQPTIVQNKIIKVLANTFTSLIDLLPSFDTKVNATAIGIAANDDDMGTFTGSIISDNTTAKNALQELETVVDAINDRFIHVVNLVDDCNGVGDNTTDNTAALNLAISLAQAASAARSNMPIGIYVPPGLYKYTSVLDPINKSVVFFSDSTRPAQLVPVGNFNALTFVGAGSRCTNAGLRNIAMNATGMTGGYAVIVDWTQDFLLENVLLASTYDAISVRQSGGTSLRKVVIDQTRNSGLYAFANNAARNGENDQIDLITFEDCVFTSNYVAGGAASTVPLLTLDGRVHTTSVAGLRLLNGGKGFVTANTPGLASNFVPRFLTGWGLEIENMYSTCMDIPVARDFWISELFAVGSQTGDGVKLGSAVNGFKVTMGNIDSNYLCGVECIGATDVSFKEVKCYNNSIVGSGVKSQYFFGAGTGSVRVSGGLAGKEQTLPAYTENGKYGIEFDAAFAGVGNVDFVDVRGNATGTIYDGGATAQGTRVVSCRGHNPIGASLQAVGASPYAYTAGLTEENVTVYGGTGVVMSVNGVAVTTTSPASILLQPRQTVSISYATVPTMAVNKA